MSIEFDKLMNLSDGKVLYDDLRQRIDQVGGSIIDDTAGVGDTDKTYSSDKLATDHGSLLNAILQLAQKVVYVDDNGAKYYQDLHDAFYSPVSIEAVFTQGDAKIYSTDDLSVLNQYLVVTATYSDKTTSIIPSASYTLSGTLVSGTSTITVTYKGLTDTFDVTVTAEKAPIYKWDFTKSLIDEVSSVTATTTATQNENGLVFSANQQYIEFPQTYARDRTYELKISSISRADLTKYGRIFMVDADSNTATGGSGYILTGTVKSGDLFYMNSAWEPNIIVSNAIDPDGSYYNNCTLGFYVDEDGKVTVYKDGTVIGQSTGGFDSSYDGKNTYIGSSITDVMRNATFLEYAIYSGNKYET